MSAGRYNIVCEAGATLDRTLVWKDSAGTPINLSGYSAKAMVKDESGTSAVLLLEFSTATGEITLGGALGTIHIVVPYADTRIEIGRHLWSLEMTTGTTVTRLVEGAFIVSGEVTT
jgi:hypothetical protein